METITLEQVYYIGQTVAVVAIIVSLIYLSLQVKQNTRTTRLETVQAISSEFHGFYDLLVSNRDVADVFHRGMFDFQSLDRTEQLQFTFAITRALRTWHEHYFQWREGAMDDEFWQSWAAILSDAMQYPGYQEVWSRRRHHYTRDFQSFVDECITDPKDAKSIYDPPGG